MADKPLARFLKLRGGPVPLLDRVQDNIGNALNDLAADLSDPDLLVVTFTTAADPPGIETGFPLVVSMGSALQPQGVKVVRAENLTSPTTLFYEAVTAPAFTYSGSNLSIPFITGLEPSTQYRLTLELAL